MQAASYVALNHNRASSTVAAPDGRLLMVKDDATSSDGLVATEGKIISAENWFEEVTRLVPTN